jgi:hypothetical protein
MPSRSSVLVATLLVTGLSACAGRTWLPVTGPKTPGAAAAALSAFWHFRHAEPPTHLAVNLPMGTAADSAALEALLMAPGTITLFHDTSRYSAASISADSQAVLGEIYDLRPILPAEWDSLVAADSNIFRGIDICGVVYRVSREWCRGWPCHDGAWVDVQPAGRRFLGVMFAMWTE